MPDARDVFQEQLATLRRSHILDAATRVFAERGFHRTTVRDVAKAAGVADGTIYNYFENKTALLLGIMDRLNETDRRGEDMARATDMDMREFTWQYMRQRLEFVARDNGQVFRIVLSEVLVDAELRELFMQKIVGPTYALAEARYKHLADMGKFPAQDIALRLRLMSATVLGAITLWILGDPQLQTDWDRLPDVLTTMMYDGLIPDDGGHE